MVIELNSEVGVDLIQVPVLRLSEMCATTPGFTPWGYPIAPEEFRGAVCDGRVEPKPRKRFPGRCTERERQHHIRRVAYLVINGWHDPIDIDVGVPSLGCCVGWPIQDGNHRFYAAIIREDPFILAIISGELDYAEKVLGVKSRATLSPL
jgi:hypothetical protein